MLFSDMQMQISIHPSMIVLHFHDIHLTVFVLLSIVFHTHFVLQIFHRTQLWKVNMF